MSQIKASLVKTCPTSNPFEPVKLNPGPGTNLISQIQKLDSVHDFGGTRGNNLATDTITKRRDNGEYSYDQMRLSFIQKYSFDSLKSDIPDIPIQEVSNFSFPGAGQQPRIVDDIENYIMYWAINDATSNKGKLYGSNFFCASTKPDITPFKTTKTTLATFFANYTDTTGTGKINFIVDTPGDLTKILKSDKSQDQFAYVLTQESAHDSAKGKPTTLSPIVIDEAYNSNGFCEAFTNQSRTYAFKSDNSPGNFESNFTIKFEGMKYNPGKKETFFISVKYDKPGFEKGFDCTLNSLVHPTNVPQITKDVANITKGSTLKLNDKDKSILLVPQSNYVNMFYSSFNDPSTKYNYEPDNQNLLDFNFTKKRAGDGLQARICQYINTGSITLQCYKRAKTGATAAGLNTTQTYDITKLILVTIDRVLFSYCIKNDIPAVYSGTDFFIFFNPLGADQRAGTISDEITIPILPMEYKKGGTKNNIVGKKINKNIQKGGDMSEFFNEINEIPYIIFKLLPFILIGLINNGQMTRDIPATNVYIRELQKISDSELSTQYGNDMVFLTKLDTDSKPLFTTDDDIQTNAILYFANNNYVVKETSGKYNLVFPSTTAGRTTGQTVGYDEIIGLLNNESTVVFTRSRVDAFIQENLEDITSEELQNLVTASSILSYFGETEGTQIQSGGANGKNLLDIYVDLILNNPNISQQNTLELTNFATLLAYFMIFSSYELALCYDNDLYEQHFNNINNVEVCKNIGLYVMFDLLLNDFLQQKSNISYGLLEYFINSGDTTQTQNYLSISTDLMELIQYVYCNDTRLTESLNAKLEQQIQSGTINQSDTIFTASQTYFAELFDRIQTKQREIETYLEGTNTDINVENYIKTNLNMYGFMNMTENFMNTLQQGLTPGENLASGIREPKIEEVEPQIKEEEPEIEDEMYKKQPPKSLLPYFQPSKSRALPTGVSPIIAAGGASKKNNKKHKKTRKQKKIKNKKTKTHKRTKRIHKRTRRN
jgi:hypothetical protein